MRGGYTHIPFFNVLDPSDVAAFFGNSPCAAVNDKDLKDREEACNGVTSAGQFGCLYDAKVHMCQPMKHAFRQVMQEQVRNAKESDALVLSDAVPRTSVSQLLKMLRRLAHAYLMSGDVDPRARVRVEMVYELLLADPEQGVQLVAELNELAHETGHEILLKLVEVARQLLGA